MKAARCTFLVALVSLAAAAAAAAAAASGTDPRKCSIGTDAKTALYCGDLNARLAVRRHLGNGDISCVPASPKLLVWRCAYNHQPSQPAAITVTFRALANGWHTVVAAS